MAQSLWLSRGFVLEKLRALSTKFAPVKPQPTDALRKLGEDEVERESPRSGLTFLTKSASDPDDVERVREQKQ